VNQTYRTIAELAGCSAATVSRVVNRNGQVSEATRTKVLNAARKLGCVGEGEGVEALRLPGTGRSAAQPRQGRLIEVIQHWHSPVEPVHYEAGQLVVGPVQPLPGSEWLTQGPRISVSFYQRILDGVLQEAGRWFCRAAVQVAENLDAPGFLEALRGSETAGVILMGKRPPQLDSFVEALRAPLVLVDMLAAASPVAVTMDNLRGVSLAFEHLRGLGHRQIGFVGASTEEPEKPGRYAVYRWLMSEAGLPIPEAFVYRESVQMAKVQAWAEQLLRRKEHPSAFLCQQDFVAVALLRAAQATGLAVPRDLSVVGFDDIEAAALMTPPLTTVRVPTFEIGRVAVRELMLQRGGVESRPAPHYVVRLGPELVVRGSTAPRRDGSS
jgi:DNA-binding LacI/PurR family transcriptional regulator